MAFTNPERNLAKAGIKESMTVADFGCGPGDYTFAAAKQVGTSGKVYAIDVQQDILTRLKNDAAEHRLSNIETICGDIEDEGGTHLGDESVDVVVVSNVLFQIEDKRALAAEAFRIVKEGGKVLLVCWSESFGHFGPTPDHVVTKEQAEEHFTREGFTLDTEFDAGDHHYGLLLTKQNQ